MISIPKDGKTCLKYDDKLAKKYDYIVILNDDVSSNVSDLFILWNQKSKVFVASFISDLYEFAIKNKLKKNHKVLLIGTSNVTYGELKKAAYFLKYYFLIDFKLKGRELLLDLFVNPLRDKKNNLYKFLHKIIFGNTSLSKIEVDSFNNYKEISALIKKIYKSREKLEEELSFNTYLKHLNIYTLYPLEFFLVSSNYSKKEINKIINSFKNINLYLSINKGINEILNLKNGDKLDKYNYFINKSEDFLKYKDKTLSNKEVKILRNDFLNSSKYKSLKRRNDKRLNEIYDTINLSRIINDNDKQKLLGLITFLEVIKL